MLPSLTSTSSDVNVNSVRRRNYNAGVLGVGIEQMVGFLGSSTVNLIKRRITTK
jgi:hypothetical protein